VAGQSPRQARILQFWRALEPGEIRVCAPTTTSSQVYRPCRPRKGTRCRSPRSWRQSRQARRPGLAARRPNLINVAVSRAKQRLYVIGNHAAWSTQPHFDQLARTPREALETQAALVT
jgi:hypothetical protein